MKYIHTHYTFEAIDTKNKNYQDLAYYLRVRHLGMNIAFLFSAGELNIELRVGDKEVNIIIEKDIDTNKKKYGMFMASDDKKTGKYFEIEEEVYIEFLSSKCFLNVKECPITYTASRPMVPWVTI